MSSLVKDLVFVVPNRHIPQSGRAPNLDASQLSFSSYFENDYGEQMVVTFSHEEGAWLYHGDIGWEEPVRVEDGVVSGYVLSEGELKWLELCWQQIELREKIKQSQEEKGGENNGS